MTTKIQAIGRLELQRRMRKILRKFYSEGQIFDVGDISRYTNLLDALGLIAKRYDTDGRVVYVNKYVGHPLFKNDIFRRKIIGFIEKCFKGELNDFNESSTVIRIRSRLNHRWEKSYKNTILKLWKGVPDAYMDEKYRLNPTHEQEERDCIPINSDRNKKEYMQPKNDPDDNVLPGESTQNQFSNTMSDLKVDDSTDEHWGVPPRCEEGHSNSVSFCAPWSLNGGRYVEDTMIYCSSEYLELGSFKETAICKWNKTRKRTKVMYV